MHAHTIFLLLQQTLRWSANCSNNKRGNHYYRIMSKPMQFHMLCLLWTLMTEISYNKIIFKMNAIRYLHSLIQCNYKIRNCGCSLHILFNWEPLMCILFRFLAQNVAEGFQFGPLHEYLRKRSSRNPRKCHLGRTKWCCVLFFVWGLHETSHKCWYVQIRTVWVPY